MPFVTVNGLRTFYRLEGKESLPMLVLSHSIGTDHGLWELQMQDLLLHFQVLRYDIRGHGASDAPDGDYSIEQLGRDFLGLAEALKLGKFSFCGLSLGGAIGQWIAVHAPELLSALILASTSPRIGSVESWSTRIKAVRDGGMSSIAELAMGRFFSPKSIAESRTYVQSIRSVFVSTGAEGYIGCCAALRDCDFSDKLKDIHTPTLVIVGDHDVSTPWAGNGEVLAQRIPGAQAVRFPGAHLLNLETPKSFTTAICEFLLPRPISLDEVRQAGIEVRRRVLGDTHVDAAIANTNDFTRDFQDLITRYAWGTIWTRPGLDEKTRRLLVLATTAALGRWEEFRLHIRTGLAHDLELADIKEVLLQAAIYAGVPAANTGFHIVQEEIKRLSE
jgi:3-oxoadipate enol-lactonase / 4-carboxymuconolactone decarboxylase